MLADLLPALIFSLLLVFARVGAMLMVLPGFGEAYISPRVRLVIALALSVVVQPVVGGALPAMPAQPLDLLPLLFGEIVIGVVDGGPQRGGCNTGEYYEAEQS